jgi:hypothetical protein
MSLVQKVGPFITVTSISLLSLCCAFTGAAFAQSGDVFATDDICSTPLHLVCVPPCRSQVAACFAKSRWEYQCAAQSNTPGESNLCE